MSTESQHEAFGESEDMRHTNAAELAEWMRDNCPPDGFNVDEAYVAWFDAPPTDYQRVAALRNAMKDIRQQGIVQDSGVKRSNWKGNANQNVWTLGDDRDVVLAHKIIKLHKLADELGYRVEKI